MRPSLILLLATLAACSNGRPGSKPTVNNGYSREFSFNRADWTKRTDWGAAGPDAAWTAKDAKFAAAEPMEVTASDVTLDFRDLADRSSEFMLQSVEGLAAKPWNYTRTGIVIEDKRSVRIQHLNMSGFKVGIHVRNCESVTIEHCTFRNMFRQKLRSTPDAEDARDWLWPHHNDENEWLKNYGGAICLENCRRCVVRNCNGREGQNGVVLSRCENCVVADCDFSWHSGWGCALWRSCCNEVSGNRFDYCVRGYSHGKYARGQDTAGILLFEQCDENVIAWNSATHSGDGLFLYAGHETTQRTGKGGCNRNTVYRNDFSCAVANGIEATFSEGNRFIGNVLVDCDYGIWAGYSYGSLIADNTIRRSLTAGIAIEHGHENRILGNTLGANRLGIWLWWDEDPGLTGGVYGKNQDTASHGYEIKWNRFEDDATAILLDATSDVQIESNDFRPREMLLDCRGKVNAVALTVNNFHSGRLKTPEEPGVMLGTNWKPTFGEQAFDVTAPEELKFGRLRVGGTDYNRRNKARPHVSNGLRKLPGRDSIVIGELGPMECRHPAVLQFEAWPGTLWLAGQGDWRFEVSILYGDVELAQPSGTVPARVDVRPRSKSICEFDLRVSWFPVRGQPGIAGAGTNVCGIATRQDWKVSFWKWQAMEGHDGPADFKALTATAPVKTVQRDGLNYNLQTRAPEEGVPADFFATVAESEFDLPEGIWRFITTSDDGVRVYLNDELIIDNWTIHGPTEDSAQETLKAGKYRVRIEHFEREGWAALSFRLEGW